MAVYPYLFTNRTNFICKSYLDGMPVVVGILYHFRTLPSRS